MKKLAHFQSIGFEIINNLYTSSEIENLIQIIESETSSINVNDKYRKSEDLFAIRQFHKEIPAVLPIIFNHSLKQLILTNFGSDYFISKSIYFDKPEMSNWFVAYHQDLTISVNKKIELPFFENWTVKQNQYAVQPPKEILEKNFTIRIHLDETTAENGALKVLNGSHLRGIFRIDKNEFNNFTESICEVNKGGVMFMKPLLYHSSNKTINKQRRRVIHLEFSNQILPKGLEWSEKMNVF